VFTISPSQIEDFQLCPLRWSYSRRLAPTGPPSLAMLRGTAIHDSWEQFVNAKPSDRSLEMLEANLSLAWNSLEEEQRQAGQNMDEPKIIKAWQKNRADSRKMLEAYWEKFGQDVDVSGGAAEVTLSLPFDDFTLQARLDYLTGMNIHELKTTGGAPRDLTWYNYFIPQVRYQLLLASCHQTSAKNPPTAYVTVIWPNGAVRLEKFAGAAELERTYREVLRVGTRMLEMNRLSPAAAKEHGHEGYHCLSCRFYDPCLARLGGNVQEETQLWLDKTGKQEYNRNGGKEGEK